MLNNIRRRSHARGKRVVPYRWQATGAKDEDAHLHSASLIWLDSGLANTNY